MPVLFVLLIAAACAACASPGGTPSDETTPRQAAIFQSPETGTLMTERPRASIVNLSASPQAVWLAVKRVYVDLDVPITVDDPAARQVGNESFNRSRNFAGQSMVNFVDCGSSMTGPKAASYRIYMSLLTMVIPDANGGTKVQTTFVPMGQDIAGGSSDRIPCGTTGRLERLVLDKVNAELGGGAVKMPPR